MRTRLVIAGLVALVLSACPLVNACRCAEPTTADLEKRIQELEAIVRRLESVQAKPARAEPTLPAPRPLPEGQQEIVPGPGPLPPPPPAGPGLVSPPPPTTSLETRRTGDALRGDPSRVPTAGWDNCFFIRSPDKSFVFRITGQLQTDYRDFMSQDDTVDIDTFLIRRARLGIEATLFDHYEFRLMPDFGQGTVKLQDGYMNVRYVDCVQFEAGKFKQPFSYEQLIQDRYVPLMERSLIDQMVPARDVGVAIHGEGLFGDRLDYAVALSNGEINGDTDTNNPKDVNARVVVRPLRCWEAAPWCQWLQFGISAGIGDEEEPLNPSTIKLPSTVPWLKFNSSVFADGRRTRWSPEAAYFFRSFGCAWQYYHEDQQVRPAKGSPLLFGVPTTGYYFMASYLLTGEERTTYSQAIAPLRPFNPMHLMKGPGAWEVVARVSRLNFGDTIFTNNLADASLYSTGATEMTLGFNWYLNKWVRTQLNWEHAWFDEPVRLGPGPQGLFNSHDSLLMRFQVIF